MSEPHAVKVKENSKSEDGIYNLFGTGSEHFNANNEEENTVNSVEEEKVTRGLQVARKWSSGFEISSKQVVPSPRKVDPDRHKTLASTQDRYLVLSARLHRGATPQPAHELAAVSLRRISGQTVHSRLAEISLYARSAIWCIPLIASNRKDHIL
ncbi:hypothetical protein TNCV_265471 [Trichonephila clavipes]|nr:hypothetical protein TNCV_265471 [Trichonephila clavipes]